VRTIRFDMAWVGVLGALVLAGGGEAVWAGGVIVLGPSDGLALDQPRVSIQVIDDQTGGDPESLGPDMSNTFLLDTAANGIMAVGPAESELRSHGYETVAIYDEQGVAGFTPMDVSAAYRLDFAGDSGVRQSISDARILSNSSLNFGSFNGILGMPAMVGHTTSLDFSVWSGIAATFLGVDFSTAPPPGSGHRYSVPLELIDFPQTGQRNPDDPLPTWAPLPSTEATFRDGAEEVQERFLVDTGAQLSVISPSIAFALGLDRDGDGTFNEEMTGALPVGGIGGEVIMPILEIDSLAIGTEENVDLVWTDLTVGVLDIDASISGVLGMELLTSGWFQKVLFGAGPDGYIEQVHFDFRAADQMQGTMFLDINPDLDVPVFTAVPGDMDVDGDVDFDDIPAFVLGLTDPAAYLAQYGQAATVHGDLDQSGTFDDDDIEPLVAMLNTPAAATAIFSAVTAVPEPGALVLLISALLAAGLIRVARE
jgi:hypothetical protein